LGNFRYSNDTWLAPASAARRVMRSASSSKPGITGWIRKVVVIPREVSVAIFSSVLSKLAHRLSMAARNRSVTPAAENRTTTFICCSKLTYSLSTTNSPYRKNGLAIAMQNKQYAGQLT
jgi:hypothetical protein